MTLKKFPVVEFRAPHAFDSEANSDGCCVKDFGKSLTVQSMAEDNDVTKIMERFNLTGRMPESWRMPTPDQFGVVEPVSFRQAQDYVVAAREAFESLPALVRSRFGNDPQALLSFVSDDANRAEAERIGLVAAKPAAPAVTPPAVAPAST